MNRRFTHISIEISKIQIDSEKERTDGSPASYIKRGQHQRIVVLVCGESVSWVDNRKNVTLI